MSAIHPKTLSIIETEEEKKQRLYAANVDQWVEENNERDAHHLLDEHLPRARKKLDRLDKQIRDVLAEIKKVFPEAQYYTASGGFHLCLGPTHDDTYGQPPQPQRVAWSGRASIGDGDW